MATANLTPSSFTAVTGTWAASSGTQLQAIQSQDAAEVNAITSIYVRVPDANPDLTPSPLTARRR